MGFGIKKSFKLGKGIRINISDKGIGYSIRTKVLKITKTVDGRMKKTISIPDTDISYTSESSVRRKETTNKNSVSENVHNNIHCDVSTQSKEAVNKKSWFSKFLEFDRKHNHKGVIGLLIFLFFTFGVAGYINDKRLTHISLLSEQNIVLDIDQEIEVPFTIKPSAADISSLIIEKNDEIHAYIVDSTLKVRSRKKEGIFYIQLVCGNIKSEKLEVKVIDKVKEAQRNIQEEQRKAEEAKLEEERRKEERLAEEARMAEEKKKEEQSNSNGFSSGGSYSNGSNSIVSPSTNNQSTVYIASSGKKYHINPKCSNMKSPIAITKEEAVAKGRTPCSRCH